MTTADRTAGLRAARAKDSADKRRRAREAIDALEAAGTPVTATAVADAAGVSTWLVYADGLREHLDQARRRQAPPVPGLARTQAVQAPATPVSLRTDLALAREEIRRLRADNDKLRQRLRLHLGAEIDGPSRAELTGRLADLETINRQLLAERDARTAENHDAQRRIRDLEDDLTAARESLRRVIKQNNRPALRHPDQHDVPHVPHPATTPEPRQDKAFSKKSTDNGSDAPLPGRHAPGPAHRVARAR